MSDARKKPKYYVHENGFIMPYGFPPENFKSSLTYVAEGGDIFICTYPKCGTTWTQNILYLMLNKGTHLQPGQNIGQFIPHLEEVGKEVVSTLPKPRIIKTHFPYELTPQCSNAKYIYVTRNPKDCCVSFYHHTKGYGKYYDFEDGTFDDYFDLFLQGKVDFGDYFDNLLSWIAHTNEHNVLFLLYEEMKINIEACIKKTGEFLGGIFLESSQNPHILKTIIEKSAFKSMKATPTFWSSGQSKDSPGFIRKGEVGDWRKHFSDHQSRLMDEKFKAKLAGTEAENLWDYYDC